MSPDQLLTGDERAYFSALEDLFNSKGWEFLTREMRADMEQLPLRAFQNAKSYEELQTARAKAAALSELLAAPTAYQLSKDSIIQAREAPDEQEG